MTAWKVANRWGWLLTVGTLLTALSLVPIIVENESLSWFEWFGAIGGLSMMLLRPTSSAGFVTAGVIGLLANMVGVAVVLEVVLRGYQLMRRRRVAHP